MLYFNFNGYEGFKERFGIQHHGNGTKSRKNKILLAFAKSEFKKGNYEAINFTTMAELKNYVWAKLQLASYADETLLNKLILNGSTFYSNVYATDEWDGICEDHDSRSIRYKNMEQNGRVYKMKAGKMIHHLINATEYGRSLCEPVQRWLEEEFSLEWQTYCMGKLPENRLIVNEDFKRIYSSESCVGNFGSCMVNQGHWKYYQNSVNAKAAFLVDEDDMVIARAILWPEVYDDEGNKYRYLDRQYSSDSNQVLMRALIDELIKADMIDIYKVPGCGCSEANAIVDRDGKSMSHKTFRVKCSLATYEAVSYQDTFKWYDYNSEFAYNSESHDWDYTLDTTNYSLDDDDDENEESNFDEYHQEWTDADLCTVYVHGDSTLCAEDWLEDFEFVERLDEYHHEDDVFFCPECKRYELNSHKYHSDITGKDYCSDECRKDAEEEYVKAA